MEARAVTKYTGISPQKTRWVIDQVRGMQAEKALALLRYMQQSAAEPVAKTIASALANAEENLGLAREDMYIADRSWPMALLCAAGAGSVRAAGSSRSFGGRRTSPSFLKNEPPNGAA